MTEVRVESDPDLLWGVPFSPFWFFSSSALVLIVLWLWA
jgi:hypothetical protein